MDSWARDFRHAVRSLARRPGLFAVASLSLALGISANTTIFAAIDAYLIRPLTIPDQDRVIQVWTTNPNRGWRRASSSIPDYRDLKQASRTTELAAFTGGSFNLSSGDRPERITGSRVSPSFFPVMGVRPFVGRTFRPEEELQGAAPVAVLSHDFWQQRFAGDRGMVGRTVLLDGTPFTVVGIMPPDFRLPDFDTDVWTPLVQTGTEERSSRFVQIAGRLRPGVSLDVAVDELRSIAGRLATTYGENVGNSVNAVPLHRAIYNEEFRRGATVSMVAVVFVLLIACANVANLLLARATGRARELALRTALGAGRTRLLRHLLTESIVLALAGGALGAIFSIWGIKAFVSLIPPGFARTDTIGLDTRALLFTLAVSVACGVLFGIAPALQATRANINSALREGGRGGSLGVRHNRLGAALVVSEISLALVLLISAGLLIKGTIRMQRVDLGFEPAHLVTARVALPEAQYTDSARIAAFHQELLQRIRDLPGVGAAGATTSLPMAGSRSVQYEVDGAPKAEKGREPLAQFRAITPGYLEAMRMTLLAGRTFGEQDRVGAPLVVVVNEAFARRHWPNGDAIGKRVILSSGGPREVVGLLRDTREFGPNDEVPVMIHVPALQRPQRDLAYVVRSDVPPNALAASLRAELTKMDATLPLFAVQTMEQVVDMEQRGNYIMPRLLTAFGGIALLLAVMGVYGVMSYSVSQRTQEMGIRMALGAQRRDIHRLVLVQGGKLAAVGLVVGLALAAGATRTLSFFLLGVSAYDPVIFGGVTAALAAAAILASVVPARRAVRVDALIALRSD